MVYLQGGIMDAQTEIAIYKCMAQSSEDLVNVWKSIAGAEVIHHNRTKETVWNIMGRGVQRQNNFGDTTEVTLDINDWRELCEAVNFGV
jgi:hypothetical protein